MTRSNCLLWSVAMWWRRHRKGKLGRIRYRQSNHGWWPHFVYQEGRRMYSYVPIDPRHKICPPPVFKGRPKFGDLWN